MRARLPNAQVTFDDGIDIPRPSRRQRRPRWPSYSSINIRGKAHDVRNLSLPHIQNEMIAAVAAANPHCIVVLENGGPVTMPWVDKVSAIVEAWYPGIRGSEAVANIIFGDVNPSAKLPVTFPKKRSGPSPSHPGRLQYVPETAHHNAHINFPPFDVTYDEGLKVGYKWFEAEGKEPLFPFGFGLSYTTYAYSNLKTASAGEGIECDLPRHQYRRACRRGGGAGVRPVAGERG